VKLFQLASAGVALLGLALPASAQMIVNGNMDGVADFTSFHAVTPPGWTGVGFGGTDLWNASTTAGGTVWQASSGGGPFVHGAGVQTGVEWVSNSGFNTDTHGFWRVEFGPDTLDSALMPVPAFGVPAPCPVSKPCAWACLRTRSR
jgi:hypothetical protein